MNDSINLVTVKFYTENSYCLHMNNPELLPENAAEPIAYFSGDPSAVYYEGLLKTVVNDVLAELSPFHIGGKCFVYVNEDIPGHKEIAATILDIINAELKYYECMDTVAVYKAMWIGCDEMYANWMKAEERFEQAKIEMQQAHARVAFCIHHCLSLVETTDFNNEVDAMFEDMCFQA